MKNRFSGYFFFAETKAQIPGKIDRVVKVGSTLRLTCKVYLGRDGPDEDYKKTAVVHWFHDQRLLDPELENWRSAETTKKAKLATGMEVTKKGIRGWLEVRRTTPYDAGNYSCVPSYAIPDWTQVHIMHGKVFSATFFLFECERPTISGSCRFTNGSLRRIGGQSGHVVGQQPSCSRQKVGGRVNHASERRRTKPLSFHAFRVCLPLIPNVFLFSSFDTDNSKMKYTHLFRIHLSLFWDKMLTHPSLTSFDYPLQRLFLKSMNPRWARGGC